MSRYFRASVDLNLFGGNGITANGKYLVRVRSRKDFQALTTQHVLTETYGDIYKVRLGNLTANPYNSSGSGSGGIGIGIVRNNTSSSSTSSGTNIGFSQ